MTKCRFHIKFILWALLCVLMLPVRAWCAPAGTVISNTAQAAYTWGMSGMVSSSNTVNTTIVVVRTKSKVEFLQYAPSTAGAQPVIAPVTEFSTSGADIGPFAALSAPVSVGSSTPIDILNPVPLVPMTLFHEGQPVFVRLTDPDQNRDVLAVESVLVRLENAALGESELLRLKETGPNTGVFVGYIQSKGSLPAKKSDGIFTVLAESVAVVRYTDSSDAGDSSTASVMVDPYGIVFDSSTGLSVDGARISLIDASTGLAARVYGDDGISIFPATVISGGTATDAGGKSYRFPSGRYRFPFVVPGTYRLQVGPLPGYSVPSTVSTASLQKLPGGPYVIADPGSRGEVFTVNPGPPLRIDIPVDPVTASLWVTKTAGKDTVAIGDFLPYTVSVRNASARTVNAVSVTDRLPLGFRYRSGSLKIDGKKLPEPTMSGDGRTLTMTIGNLAGDKTVELRYVVEVAAGAKPGSAENSAFASAPGASRSNVAHATVQVREDLFRGSCFLTGRVISGGCTEPVEGKSSGLKGVRLYLEDGTFVVTDEKGRFHFEGLKPGVHVVQLDLNSLPGQYETVACEQNSRFAGRSDSQFVDLKGGTLWRTDFYVAPRPGAKGEVSLRLQASVKDRAVAQSVVLEGNVVPVRNLRLSLMLPEGVTYRNGSSLLDKTPLPDPEVNGNILTYRLGEFQGRWTRQLALVGTVASGGTTGRGLTKAFLIFDTPSENNQRTPTVEYEFPLSGGPSAAEKKTTVETKGLLAGEKGKDREIKVEKPGAVAVYDSALLESAAPGLEWLWPRPEFVASIPSLKLAVKHHPKETLRLLLNGTEVTPLNFEGTLTNRQQTVAVSRWSGVDLQEGGNRFELVVTDAAGRETGRVSRLVHYSGPPVKAEFVKEQSYIVADGKRSPEIAIRLTDRDGYPAREGIIGQFTVDPPYAARQEVDAYQRNPLSGMDTQALRYVVGKGGLVLVKLQPTSHSGEAVVKVSLAAGQKEELHVWLKPEIRDWILVGLGEGTMGYNTVTGHKENARAAGVDDHRYGEERIAFFGKGRVWEDWLLTAAYDNKKEKQVGKSLFQTIDPDTYFPLYGDTTEQQYEAASARKLYLKLERDQFYTLFGDYDTGLTATELSRYSRSLNGLKSEWKGRRFSYNFFASDTNQAFRKDEIRGNGTSGLYSLSRKNIVINSEKIVLETRNRFRSEVIISTKMLTRHLDYNIDYEAGTLFFREPIFSKDENLNPIFIVVDYESDDTTDKAYTYGGRGAVKLLGNKLEIGASHIHEGAQGAEGNLEGVDATLDVGKNTQIKVEAATSRKDDDGRKQQGDAYLASLTHRSDKFTGQVYARQQSVNFGLGQQNGSETGTRKIGMDAAYRINKEVNVQGQAYRITNLATDAQRDLGEAKVNYTDNRFTAQAGVRHVEDKFDDGTVKRSDQVTAGAGYRMFDNRLQVRLEREQSLGSRNENSDFPTRTILGADYAVTKDLAFFGEQEFTQGADESTQSSRLGLRATPWSGGTVSTSGGTQFTEYGPRTFANVGLRQTWNYNKKWSFDGGLDHSRTLKESGDARFNTNVPAASGSDQDFTAVSLGTTYREKDWSWTSRVESRRAENEDKWGVITGIYGEPLPGIGLSGGLQCIKTDAKNGEDKMDGDLRFGLAYRPESSPWIILDRLDLKLEDRRSSGSELRNWRIINNTIANLKPTPRTQMSLQYGLKYVQDLIDGDYYRGFIDLLGIEGRYDITKKWDIGFRASVLQSWQSKQMDYGAGLSIGYNVVQNVWLGVGYNVSGFYDEDFSEGNFTTQGPFFQFRFKFDQQTVRDALQRFVGYREYGAPNAGTNEAAKPQSAR